MTKAETYYEMEQIAEYSLISFNRFPNHSVIVGAIVIAYAISRASERIVYSIAKGKAMP